MSGMVDLLGAWAPLLSDINLILQVDILLALIIGVILVRRLKFHLHGYIMSTAVALNLLSIVLVMLPAAVRILRGASLTPFTAIVAVHSVLGAVVGGLGIYVVGVWRFRRPGGTCFKLKTHMRALVPLWTMTVVLGGAIYFLP